MSNRHSNPNFEYWVVFGPPDHNFFYFDPNMCFLNTTDHQSLLSNGNEPLKQAHKPTLVGSIGSGQKMGMKKIELASVIL